MINIEDFCDKLEGFYDNWYQAAGNPAKYAHIKLTWERIGHLEFKSKQWLKIGLLTGKIATNVVI